MLFLYPTINLKKSSKRIGSQNYQGKCRLSWSHHYRRQPHCQPDVEKFIASETSFGRVANPADIASIVTFLASDEAKWITGQKIGVSGGFD